VQKEDGEKKGKRELRRGIRSEGWQGGGLKYSGKRRKGGSKEHASGDVVRDRVQTNFKGRGNDPAIARGRPWEVGVHCGGCVYLTLRKGRRGGRGEGAVGVCVRRELSSAEGTRGGGKNENGTGSLQIEKGGGGWKSD